MITINANTKIAAIVKQHPEALEAIVSISPKFEKLRNPVLRKLMAGRASIAMASKIGGCTVQTFFEKLKPLGFQIEEITPSEAEGKKEVPAFMTSFRKDHLVELDVRPLIASGKDPLNLISSKIKTIKTGEVLKIINIFEPIPLIKLLEKQGFEVYADVVNENLVETYFFKKNVEEGKIQSPANDDTIGWEYVLQKFAGKLQTIDVRQLEMPLPMYTILNELDKLPIDKALFVHHKRIPVFLLPELVERNFDYRINEISDGEVNLLIFKA